MEKRQVNDFVIYKIPTDLTNYEIIQNIYIELKDDIEKGTKKVILDFSFVNTINSSAIGKILFLNTRISSLNGKIGLLKVNDPLKKLFKSLIIDKIFTMYDDENDIK